VKKLQLLGEYECKIDAKGRMRVPAQLIKQLEGEATTNFVMNRGLENNLMLYPKSVWDRISEEVDQLNPYDKKSRKFIRYFYRGAQILEMDGSDRILIKKALLEFAGIEKDAVLFARGDQIEVWSAKTYEMQLNEEPEEDFASLAESVMTKSKEPKPEE